MTPNSQRERMIFVDTSAFYGALDRADQWHAAAIAGFTRIAQEHRLVCTTNLVVAEVYAMCLRGSGAQAGLQWLESLAAGVQVIFQEESHHARIQAILRRHRATGVSYADAFSFVVMEERGIHTAFTFDSDFRQYGWAMWV